ncbi:MAG: MFS transporter [Myxococcales bacterium]|nr:MFS transporter [Myxococcales bacterium]MCB9716748.1 MFS transporter [Myxococcales bacterium]
MSLVLHHRGFGRLWLGELVSMIGDWLTYVAVGVLAVQQGGPWAILGVLLAHTVPRALVAPWAGRVADLHDRRRVLALGSVARGVTVLGMVLAAAQGSTGWLQAMLVLRMATGAFVDAAAGAAVPRLVPGAALARAHALLGSTWSVVFGAGVAAGGVATAMLGPVGVLVLDALTFFVAALLFAGLPPLRPLASGGDEGRAGSWDEVLRELAERPVLRRAVLAKAPVMIANGGGWVLLHVVAGSQSGAAMALVLGALHLARAVGTGLGPLLWLRVSALRGTELGLRASTALVLVGVSAFALAGDPLGWAGGALLWGLGMGSHWATAATRVQGLGPDPIRGRLTAIDLVTHTVGQGVGGVLGVLALGLALPCGPAVVGAAIPVALLTWVTIEGGARRVLARA